MKTVSDKYKTCERKPFMIVGTKTCYRQTCFIFLTFILIFGFRQYAWSVCMPHKCAASNASVVIISSLTMETTRLNLKYDNTIIKLFDQVERKRFTRI